MRAPWRALRLGAVRAAYVMLTLFAAGALPKAKGDELSDHWVRSQLSPLFLSPAQLYAFKTGELDAELARTSGTARANFTGGERRSDYTAPSLKLAVAEKPTPSLYYGLALDHDSLTLNTTDTMLTGDRKEQQTSSALSIGAAAAYKILDALVFGLGARNLATQTAGEARGSSALELWQYSWGVLLKSPWYEVGLMQEDTVDSQKADAGSVRRTLHETRVQARYQVTGAASLGLALWFNPQPTCCSFQDTSRKIYGVSGDWQLADLAPRLLIEALYTYAPAFVDAGSFGAVQHSLIAQVTTGITQSAAVFARLGWSTAPTSQTSAPISTALVSEATAVASAKASSVAVGMTLRL